MNKNDFNLIKNEKENGHNDFWYKVSGDSRKELENNFSEMCMVGIDEVVYSKDEDIVGVKRIFPFNYDVILSDDISLKSILCDLSK